MRNSPIHLMREIVSMSSVVSRGLRLALGSLFLFGAAMFVAPAAHAQWTQDGVCIEPSDVPEFFYGNFNGYSNCESLCKKAASHCRAFVKDQANCWHNSNKGTYGIYKNSTCKDLETPAERQECNAMANEGQQLLKGFINDDRDEALAMCDDYENGCLMSCVAVE
jgi:hypothetical protein